MNPDNRHSLNAAEKIHTLKIAAMIATRILGLFLIFPVFAIYAHEFQYATPFLIGIVIGIYGLTQALLQIPFGYFSDKYGRRKMLAVGLSIFLLGSIIVALSSDIYTLIIGRAIQGAGAVSAILMASLADFIRPQNIAKANASVGMVIGATFIVAIILSPIVTEHFGIDGLFWAVAVLAALALLSVPTLPKTPAKRGWLTPAEIKKSLNKTLAVVYLSGFFLHLILAALFVALPKILINTEIVAAAHWKIYLPALAVSAAVMIAAIIFAEKNDKLWRTLKTAILFLFAAQLLFGFGDFNHFSLLIFMTIFFIGFNLVEVILPSLVAKKTNDKNRGSMMGMFTTVQFSGAFAGGALGGLVSQFFGLSTIFIVNAIVAIFWFWMIFRLSKMYFLESNPAKNKIHYVDLFSPNPSRDIPWVEELIKKCHIRPRREILIFLAFGKKHTEEQFSDHFKIGIFYECHPLYPEHSQTGEYPWLDSPYADYLVGFLPDDERHLQIRNYERQIFFESSFSYQNLNTNWRLRKKSKFCCFIVSNPADGEMRNQIFDALNGYQKVDSRGKFKNNAPTIPGDHKPGNPAFAAIVGEYKFIICGENKSYPYYITEKIFNAYRAGTVPIYCGAPNVGELFDERTMIFINEENFDEQIARVKQLNEDDALYQKMFEHKPVINAEAEDRRVHRNFERLVKILSS